MHGAQPDITKIREWLAEKMKCPLCGQNYSIGKIKTISQNISVSKNFRVHTCCDLCHCSLIFALRIKAGEVLVLGVVTDLTHQDALKFDNMEPITANEILDFKDALDGFSDDFSALLPKHT